MADTRQDFSKGVVAKLCDRVGGQCSNPECQAPTKGPHSDGESAINVGMACHIHAASAGGPRYDGDQDDEDRRSIHNGIWLCQTCGTLIDRDVDRFPAPLLRKWRFDAEYAAFERLGRRASAAAAPSTGIRLSDEAADQMRWLRDQYIKANYPNHKVWMFTPKDQDDPVYGELRALGLVYFGGPYGGPWRLTEAGVKWIMRNRP